MKRGPKGPQQRLIARNNRIVELREQGLTQSQIANEMDVSRDTVKNVLRKAGITRPLSAQDKHDLYVNPIEKVFATVDKWSGGKYEYVSGYTHSDCKIMIRCTECGTVVERSFITMRKGNLSQPCKVCEERRKKEEREKAKKQREEARQLKALEAAMRFTERLHPCAVCGTLTTYKYCSPPCRNKASNHRHEELRRAKIANALVDSNIEIHELYRRDDGVCYICGGACDWNDKIIIDSTVICGDSYPSVDHVIPLAKGGKHAWSNVRLAHRRCNTLKRDSFIPLRS